MFPHQTYFAHTLNLATQKGMKVSQVSTLLSRVRKVVVFLHKSTTAHALLVKNRTLLGLPGIKVKTDVPTRWNSTYDIIVSHLKLQPAIFATLMSKDISKSSDICTLSDNDVGHLEKLVELLGPVKCATEVLCREDVPTVSLIAPMLHLIKRQLSVKDEDSSLMKQVKTTMLDDLNKRYQREDLQEILQLSSAVHPRFKHLPFLSEETRNHVTQILGDKWQSILIETLVKIERDEPQEPALPNLPMDDSQDIESNIEPEAMQKMQIKEEDSQGKLSQLFSDVFVVKVEPGNGMSSRTKAKDEIQLYLREAALKLDDNPLLWWRYHESTYPMLANFAKTLLCIPATSVPSERVFSSAGDIVTAQRAALKWKHVDRMIFLKKNYQIK